MLSATSRCVSLCGKNRNLIRTVATLSFAEYNNHGTRNILFLHGIMGNKRNWGNFVKLLLPAHPQDNFYTVDLRYHGNSPAMPGENTMENIALDVYKTLQVNNISIDTIIGHSFGGKVALEYMRLYNKGYSSLPKTAIILDISFRPLLCSLFTPVYDWLDRR